MEGEVERKVTFLKGLYKVLHSLDDEMRTLREAQRQCRGAITSWKRRLPMKEAPDINQENGETAPDHSNEERGVRIQWKQDDILKDAKCVGFYLLANKLATKPDFGVKFMEMWRKVCMAQFGKHVNLKQHVKDTQDKDLKMIDLYNRALRGLGNKYASEDPRVNQFYKDNYARLEKFLETGVYPPSPPPAFYKKGDIVSEDFEW
jgi:hypothetical protein